MKIRLIVTLLVISAFGKIHAQQNCNSYLYNGDSLKYEACLVTERLAGLYQFSKEFQEVLDEALAIDSTYDYAYRAKSVGYLKSGDFLTWKKLIDKAVLYNPVGNLGYRGWCRYQFFGDYEGAIEDIERLDSLINYDIGTSANGDYHLQIARALSYKALGHRAKAIEIIETQLADAEHFVGKYDYLHLGVLYLENDECEKALDLFTKQEKENDLAENQYYIAMVYRELNHRGEYIAHLEKAIDMYKQGRIMLDGYTHIADKVYLSEIETELKKARGISG
ncbi:hypothetical protein PBT90_08275 [Algoriphagus halophytocola]|uniref:Tetratricopeptide repeat protein n=1 Tax=Algoriphagus halophytocola TaxID=2991499 RepID=A0ABY6MJY4_9BACT|nr:MULTISPECIES: hypothetical protein [unclassified Algoriphagus]UZD23380.1 hypothetical protein OM944_02590 [Algoriphagus sp. TR-M5]WBL44675.1 hypothetical protein PBT90_08275 [Algoriphagus sp. TR-M9]